MQAHLLSVFCKGCLLLLFDKQLFIIPKLNNYINFKLKVGAINFLQYFLQLKKLSNQQKENTNDISLLLYFLVTHAAVTYRDKQVPVFQISF